MNLDALKSKTERFLQENGIEINTELPTIELLEYVSPQSAENVAKRICALTYVVGVAYDAKRDELIEQLKGYGLWSSITYREQRLLQAPDVSQNEKLVCSWIPESIQALAWCIGLVELDNFKHCDDDLAEKIPFKTDPQEFIRNSSLKPLNAIQSQSDMLYRMHWAAVNARLSGKVIALDEGTIMYRRQAIDWVYGVEPEWEDIPLDT